MPLWLYFVCVFTPVILLGVIGLIQSRVIFVIIGGAISILTLIVLSILFIPVSSALPISDNATIEQVGSVIKGYELQQSGHLIAIEITDNNCANCEQLAEQEIAQKYGQILETFKLNDTTTIIMIGDKP